MNMDHLALLILLRKQLDEIKIHNSEQAEFVCRLIPTSCPFERDFKLGDRTIFRIPSVCKLNPFYQQLVELRFRAQAYLTQHL